MSKHPTNTEFVTHLMEFNNSGPMAQVFIVEAIRKYADEVANNPDMVRDQWKLPIVSADAWISAATSIQSAFKTQYGE
tara:strand:+ start:218 stop:451 length:234 start_codon:yes stop_codon:yes gene_type:complete